MEARDHKLAVASVDAAAVAHQRIVNLRSIQQRAQFRVVKLGHHSFLTLESFPGGLIVRYASRPVRPEPFG